MKAKGINHYGTGVKFMKRFLNASTRKIMAPFPIIYHVFAKCLKWLIDHKGHFYLAIESVL